MSQSGGSLTRKTKKDDVEALLSDFDNLDTTKAGIKSKKDGPSSSSPSLTANRRTGNGSNSSSLQTTTKDDAQLLLDDLDDLVKQRRATTPKKTSLLSSSNNNNNLASESSTKNTSRAATPTVDASQNSSIQVGEGKNSFVEDDGSTTIPLDQSPDKTKTTTTANPTNQASWGGWWSSATKLADQARAELEKRAAEVKTQVVETTSAAAAAAAAAASAAPMNSQLDMDGKPLMEENILQNKDSENPTANVKLPWQFAAQNINAFIKTHGGDLNKLRSDIGKVGMKRWNEIVNVVAPPIESHEVLSITLSHDMIGFEGVPDVVFQILQRVMEDHAESHNAEQQLIVNKAAAKATVQGGSSTEGEDQPANLCPVIGFNEAWKLAESRLDELVNKFKSDEQSRQSTENNPTDSESATLPITTRPLFIRIQPVLDVLPGTSRSTITSEQSTTHLFVCIILRDPTNNLSHRTISQPIPKQYALLPFEQNSWAEELLSESLQGALGSVGVDYVRSRMQARSEALAKAAALDENSENPTSATSLETS